MKLTDLEMDIILMEKKVEDAGNELLEHPTPANAMKYAQAKLALKRMRNRLSEMSSSGMSPDDISKAMDIPVKSVKYAVFNSRFARNKRRSRHGTAQDKERQP